jgi:hypothetical protein
MRGTIVCVNMLSFVSCFQTFPFRHATIFTSVYRVAIPTVIASWHLTPQPSFSKLSRFPTIGPFSSALGFLGAQSPWLLYPLLLAQYYYFIALTH